MQKYYYDLEQYIGSIALLWHNAKVLSLSKVVTLTGYNQNFFVFHQILMKLGDTDVVVPNITKFHQNLTKNKKVLIIAC